MNDLITKIDSLLLKANPQPQEYYDSINPEYPQQSSTWPPIGNLDEEQVPHQPQQTQEPGKAPAGKKVYIPAGQSAPEGMQTYKGKKGGTFYIANIGSAGKQSEEQGNISNFKPPTSAQMYDQKFQEDARIKDEYADIINSSPNDEGLIDFIRDSQHNSLSGNISDYERYDANTTGDPKKIEARKEALYKNIIKQVETGDLEVNSVAAFKHLLYLGDEIGSAEYLENLIDSNIMNNNDNIRAHTVGLVTSLDDLISVLDKTDPHIYDETMTALAQKLPEDYLMNDKFIIESNMVTRSKVAERLENKTNIGYMFEHEIKHGNRRTMMELSGKIDSDYFTHYKNVSKIVNNGQLKNVLDGMTDRPTFVQDFLNIWKADGHNDINSIGNAIKNFTDEDSISILEGTTDEDLQSVFASNGTYPVKDYIFNTIQPKSIYPAMDYLKRSSSTNGILIDKINELYGNDFQVKTEIYKRLNRNDDSDRLLEYMQNETSEDMFNVIASFGNEPYSSIIYDNLDNFKDKAILDTLVDNLKFSSILAPRIINDGHSLSNERIFNIFKNNQNPEMALALKDTQNTDQWTRLIRKISAWNLAEEHIDDSFICDADFEVRKIIADRLTDKNKIESMLQAEIKDFGSNIRGTSIVNTLVRKYDKSKVPSLLNNLPIWTETNNNVYQELLNRLNPKDVYRILERMDNDTPIHHNTAKYLIDHIDIDNFKRLKDMPNVVNGDTGGSYRKRAKNITAMGEKTIQNFLSTGQINFVDTDQSIIEKIKNIDGITIKTTDIVGQGYDAGPLDELFFNHQSHSMLRDEWLGSSSNNGSGLLKDSVARVFGGKVVYHNGEIDTDSGTWAETVKDIYDTNNVTPDEVDAYIKDLHNVNQQLLDIRFPGQTEFIAWRGSTGAELADKNDDNIILNQNPISSWSLKKSQADKFGYAHGENEIGAITMEIKVDKKDILASYLTYSHSGFEAEVIIKGAPNRAGKIVPRTGTGYKWDDITKSPKVKDMAGKFKLNQGQWYEMYSIMQNADSPEDEDEQVSAYLNEINHPQYNIAEYQEAIINWEKTEFPKLVAQEEFYNTDKSVEEIEQYVNQEYDPTLINFSGVMGFVKDLANDEEAVFDQMDPWKHIREAVKKEFGFNISDNMIEYLVE